MKKASYRLLQWTMLMGTTALISTACVVTSDGGGDDFFDGGESGEGGGTTAGSSTGGKAGSSTAGTSSGGKAGSSTGGTAGSTTGGSDNGGAGGTDSSYVPGLCQVDNPTATMLPSCAPLSTDEATGGPCKVCLKSKCCEEWQTCFGDTPTTACGWGETEDSPGQFDCIRDCYITAQNSENPPNSPQEGLEACESVCLNQCEDKDLDGFALIDTQAILGCAQDSCLVECFTE